MKTRRSKGQSLVETSLILAAFMLLLLGIVFVGGTLFIRQTFAERVEDAARWGAMNSYNPESIRNLVVYGTQAPKDDATPFLGLNAADVVVTDPGCPGPHCRVKVAIPSQGVRATEFVECDDATDDAVAKP